MMRAVNLQVVRVIAAGICVLCAGPRVPAGIIYVDAAATGADNGQTWTDAYRYLRDALAAAGQGDEIRIAQGMYRPDLGAGVSPGDRTESFQLKNGVAIKGGYAGVLASDPDERRIEEYETVFSGDLNGDDGADFSNNSDNSYNVVVAEGISPLTVLEGLSVSGGNANGGSGRWDKGGGIYCYIGSPTIRQCAFKGNSARQFAGGMYLDYICSPQISQCIYSGNKAASGGALANGTWCYPQLRDCTFENNHADDGGAVFNRESSTPTYTDCEFRNNSATADGGGVKNYGSSAIYNGCMFSRNKAYEGGGMYSIGSYTPGYQPPQLMSCTFVRNSASYNGGAMFNNIIEPVVSGCVFRSNSAGFGGAIHNWKSSPSVENCTFTGNFASLHGGALDATNNSSPTVTNCTFSLNCGNRGGGALFCLTSSAVQVSNCILWGNLAPEGAQVYVGASQEPASMSISYSDVEGGSAAAYVGSGCELIWGEGNIDGDPLLTADGHLSEDSPCTDGGTPAGAPSVDRDGDGRPYGAAVDIGADEFIDTDGDGLPDYWEQDHFGGPNAAIPGIDSDGDGLSNSDEYERYGSDPNARPYYVDASAGDDDYDGRWQTPQGNGAGPKKTIAAVVDAAGAGDTILAAAGSYTGPGNRGIDFDGKAVILRAAGAATIDCGGSDRGFYFHYGETRQTAIIGFTITGGAADRGGAIRCERAHPQIRDCLIIENTATESGGGIYCHMAMPELDNCDVRNNSPEGAWMDWARPTISGVVQTSANNWVARDVVLRGEGEIVMAGDVTLYFDNCGLYCDLSGPGRVLVGLSSELLIGGQAVMDLGEAGGTNGQIVCDGLLRLTDDATVIDAAVKVTRASFEDNAVIVNCVIDADAGAPYGQFLIEDNVQIFLDRIEADGDRYLDLDPRTFDCNNIHIDIIDVNITEGVGTAYGGLFELRGIPGLVGAVSCDPNNEFFCHAESVPQFDPNGWAINRLELTESAKLNLTNRFDFHAPYDAGGDYEALYVKYLVLGPNSVLNTAFNHLYYENLQMHPTARVVNIPLLGFSLNNISFDDENDYLARVRSNNFIDPDPARQRIHAERITGEQVDPNGVMVMRNLTDRDSGLTVTARAKGLFAKSGESDIYIRFEYLFCDPTVDGQLVVYLSDTPEMLEHTDPGRGLHYVEAGRVPQPPSGRPGSPGSNRLGVFEKVVPVGELDMVRGTRMELELLGPSGTCVLIDDWDPGVMRCITYCGDVAGAMGSIDAVDFLAVMRECGRRKHDVAHSGTGSLWCLDGYFCADGYITIHDAMAVDCISAKGSLCAHDMLLGQIGAGVSSSSTDGRTGSPEGSSGLSASGADALVAPLLIAGKRYDPQAADFLSDRLYGVDKNGGLVDGPLRIDGDRGNGRLVRDANDRLYQISLDAGVIELSQAAPVVVPPGSDTVLNEPRFGQPARVYVGQQNVGRNWTHPVLDAAFDTEGCLYVVPVIVSVGSEPTYMAAAKLQLAGHGQEPWEVVELYYDSLAPGDNFDPNLLREIDVDSEGNLYVLNVDYDNESDRLWVYDAATGQVKRRLDLAGPQGSGTGIPAPIGMVVSDKTGNIYLGSSRTEPDSNSARIYAIKKDDLLYSDDEPNVATLTINGMGHVTDITEDPVTGDIWIAGFTMERIPTEYDMQNEYTLLNSKPFYRPMLATFSPGSANSCDAMCLSDYSDSEFDLALPLSILWTGPRSIQPEPDLTGDGVVDARDLDRLADNWLNSGCAGPEDCGGADLNGSTTVDGKDLAIMGRYWQDGH